MQRAGRETTSRRSPQSSPAELPRPLPSGSGVGAPPAAVPRRLPVMFSAEHGLACMFGREVRLAELEQLLAEGARLVNVLGPGGIGKTRLATELARRLRASRPVVWVDLAHTQGRDAMLFAVCHKLGGAVDAVPEAATVAAKLERMGRAVLILDNLEQLLPEAAPLLARWLRDAPELSIVVTSRVRTGVLGELVSVLEPLRTAPGPGGALAPAAALFIDRVRLRDRSYAPDAAQLARVFELVELLEGVPLAIELAARRLPLLGMDELLLRLRRRPLEVLGGLRDDGLAAVLLRSWDLLTRRDCDALAQLTVFSTDFDVRSAERVLDEEAACLESIETLESMSLLRTTRPGRLTLYRAIGEIAAVQGSREAIERARERHLAHLEERARCGVLAPEDALEIESLLVRDTRLADPAVGRWLARLEPLLAGRGVPSTLAPVLERVLAGDRLADEARALALLLRARLAWQQGDSGATEKDARAALALAVAGSTLEVSIRVLLGAALGYLDRVEEAAEVLRPVAVPQAPGIDPVALATAWQGWAGVAKARGELEEAQRWAGAAVAVARERQLPGLEVNATILLGMTRYELGQPSQAFATLEPARELAARAGIARAEALLWAYTGLVELTLGNLAGAMDRLDRAVQLELRLGNGLHEAFARGIRAAARASADDVDGASDDLQRARVLAGGDPLSRALFRAHEGHVALARMRAALARDDRHEAQRCLAAARAAIDDPISEPETAPRRLASRNDDVRDAIVLLEQALARAPSLGGPPLPRAGRARTILVAHDASWMSVDFGERVSLASSPVLRSLLAALAERHLRSPRAVCPRPELLEAAWPGVRLRPSVLRNRLNVALSKLRKLGLGELLEHAEDGYRFAPGTVVHRA